LERDFVALTRNGLSTTIPANLALVGPPDRLWIDETARVDPYTVFDTTNGPIMVGPRAWIQPFTRVEGPCSIGAETQLFRGNIRECVSIGPNCRIGGEVEASIVHGHSNKYHEGFLGHAYVGEWVNLGAITSNSDLRNDYGEVSVPLQGDPVKTGQTKVGCFIGDPYAQLKGNWSSIKNGKPLFHHVLQRVSCWKKELPDGDRRQGRRDYTICPGTRNRGTRAGHRCYPTASKVHRHQLVADARPDSAQKTGCQG